MWGPAARQRVVGADDVYGDRAIEDRRVAPNQRQLRRDASVCDDYVEAAQPVDCPRHHIVHLGTVGDVTEPVRPVHRRRHFSQQFRFQTRDGDPRAAGVESLRERRADAARRAGNEDASALEVAHCFLLIPSTGVERRAAGGRVPKWLCTRWPKLICPR